jgi:hypothetical protein
MRRSTSTLESSSGISSCRLATVIQCVQGQWYSVSMMQGCRGRVLSYVRILAEILRRTTSAKVVQCFAKSMVSDSMVQWCR